MWVWEVEQSSESCPPPSSLHSCIRLARIMLFEIGRMSDGVCLCILTCECVCVYNFFLWTQYVCVCLYVCISFTLASRKGTASLLLTLSPFLHLGVHHSRLHILDIQSLFGIISKSI